MSTGEIKGVMEEYLSGICPEVKFKDCIRFNIYDYKMTKNKMLLSENYCLKQCRSTLLFTQTGMLFKFDFDFSNKTYPKISLAFSTPLN
jgi:hypothetical protein